MNNKNIYNILFCGIGGQGVLTASEICGYAAILDGYNAKKSEIHGMAQRGGSIIAHVRIGEKVQAPLIETGKADIILGFEMLEAARVLPMLNKNGTVIVNTKYITPSTSGISAMINDEEILKIKDTLEKNLAKIQTNKAKRESYVQEVSYFYDDGPFLRGS